MDIFAFPFKNKGAYPMILRLLLLIFCFALGACASVSVNQVAQLSPHPPRHLPRKILVKPLAFFEPNVEVDRSGRKLTQFKYDFQEKFTRHFVRRLSERIAPAEAIAATAPLPRGDYWVVSGQIDRVTQGSRLLRTVGGTPLGASRLETSIVFTDLSGPVPRPFLLIRTTGGSNVAIPVLGSRDGLTFDVIRTSRETVAALSEYLYQQGLIPYEYAVAPKRTSAAYTIVSPYERRASGPMVAY